MDVELKTEFDLGDGITMRAWREDDIQIAYDVVIRNREHLETFMHWMTPDYSRDHSRRFLTDGIVNRLQRKNLGLALFRGNDLIGSVGFVKLDWNSNVCEIGYWIDREEEGKGIVSKACRAMIEYAFEDLGMNRIEIRCSAENLRSAAVPERLGFKKEGVLRQVEIRNGRPHDFYIFGLLAEDERVW